MGKLRVDIVQTYVHIYHECAYIYTSNLWVLLLFSYVNLIENANMNLRKKKIVVINIGNNHM